MSSRSKGRHAIAVNAPQKKVQKAARTSSEAFKNPTQIQHGADQSVPVRAASELYVLADQLAEIQRFVDSQLKAGAGTDSLPLSEHGTMTLWSKRLAQSFVYREPDTELYPVWWREPYKVVAEQQERNARHVQNIRLSIQQVAQRLNSALGATLVSTLAGAKDVKASYRWANVDGVTPRDETEKKLRFAYDQWLKVSEVEGEAVARVWFIGANPWLNYQTPVLAIRDDRLTEVSIAADALASDSFSG